MQPITTRLDWFKTEIRFLLTLGSPYWYFYCLRNYEYYMQFKGVMGGGKTLLRRYYGYKLRVLGFRTGIELSPGVADIGVKVNHGKCIVSKVAKLGRDTEIVGDVTIGGVGGKRDVKGAPKIGNRVFIGTGARIIGPVHIADGVVIGANAVVNKDILENDITVAGVPAKKIKDAGSKDLIRSAQTGWK